MGLERYSLRRYFRIVQCRQTECYCQIKTGKSLFPAFWMETITEFRPLGVPLLITRPCSLSLLARNRHPNTLLPPLSLEPKLVCLQGTSTLKAEATYHFETSETLSISTWCKQPKEGPALRMTITFHTTVRWYAVLWYTDTERQFQSSNLHTNLNKVFGWPYYQHSAIPSSN
jgi:hypothetical protein